MRAWLCAITILLIASSAEAATINAASCSYSDVNTAVNTTAVDGDTVQIPAGTCSWTQTLVINNKQIVLKGAGIDVTVIKDNVPKAVYNRAVFSITVNDPKKFRLAHFTLKGDTVTDDSGQAAILLLGTSQSVRFDHIKSDGVYGKTIYPLGGVNGLWDNMQFLMGIFSNAARIDHPSWLGVGLWGDNSWASASGLGTAAAIYVEDTSFTVPGTMGASINGIIDSAAGGRQVVRFSSCQNCGWQNHGTESTQRERGGRQFEIYKNTITTVGGLNVDTGMAVRSGTGVFWGNTWSSSFDVNVGIKLWFFRLVASYPPWGVADGVAHNGASQPWDVTDGVQKWTGTHAGASGASILSVSGTPWTTNQYAPGIDNCTILNLTLGWAAEISSHTTNTLTPFDDIGFQGGHVYNTGNSVEIRCVTTVLDQPGHGQGDYISGGDGLIPPTPYGFPHDALEPIYAWSNSTSFYGNGQNNTTHAAYNRDFYNELAGFNGAATIGDVTTGGIGVGARASRPATCTVGVAWWATDQGSWNTSGHGGQGVLDKCVQPNSWQNAAYVPYAYPHPLRSDAFVGDSGAVDTGTVGRIGTIFPKP